MRTSLRALAVAGLVWLLIVLETHSDAGTSIIATYVLVLGSAALAIAWLLHWPAYAVARWRGGACTKPRAADWALLPALLAIGLGVSRPPIAERLFELRFRLSAGAFAAEARRTADASRRTVEPTPRRIGLFWVRGIATVDDQVRFITTSCGVVDSCGVVYAPSGPPRRWQEDSFTPLRGPWWRLYQGF